MKRVDVRLNLTAVAPVLDFIKHVADGLRTELVTPFEPAPDDAELTQIWREDLIAAQSRDCDEFLGLFGSEFFSTNVIQLTDENIEPVLRASNLLRMRIRMQYLTRISDDDMESEAVDLEQLEQEEADAYVAFLFLDQVQKIILEHFDLVNGPAVGAESTADGDGDGALDDED